MKYLGLVNVQYATLKGRHHALICSFINFVQDAVYGADPSRPNRSSNQRHE